MLTSCPHYRPAAPGKKRCAHYYDEFPDLAGACDRDDEFMCVVWLAKYPHSWEQWSTGRVWPVDRDGVVHLPVTK